MNTIQVNRAVASIMIAIFMGIYATADAEDVTNFGKQTPSEQDIIEALTPKEKPSAAKPGMKFRGISPVLSLSGSNSAQPSSAPAISLELTFDFNSAELTDSAKSDLNKLAGALKDPKLVDSSFMIEGHTDSAGTEEYNMWLSTERARSVRDNLVNKQDVDISCLAWVGKGESVPLNKENTRASENRRVQITNLGSQ